MTIEASGIGRLRDQWKRWLATQAVDFTDRILKDHAERALQDAYRHIEAEDLAAWLVRCVNQPSRSAFTIYFMGRTITMPDGSHKPLMGITATIWWN